MGVKYLGGMHMSNNQPAESDEVKYLPKLRFVEFKNSDHWSLKELDQIATFLKGKGISKTDIDSYAQAGNEKFYGTENCLIFARSYFGLKSFEEAENVDVQEYLLASRDNYSKFYAQKRAIDFQNMKQKSRKP